LIIPKFLAYLERLAAPWREGQPLFETWRRRRGLKVSKRTHIMIFKDRYPIDNKYVINLNYLQNRPCYYRTLAVTCTQLKKKELKALNINKIKQGVKR
jgi:hypothetical protein